MIGLILNILYRQVQTSTEFNVMNVRKPSCIWVIVTKLCTNPLYIFERFLKKYF